MVIVEMIKMRNGNVFVSFGGMEQYAMNVSGEINADIDLFLFSL